MTDKKDGGPAFPRPMTMDDDRGCLDNGASGMTLRDWFAGQVIPGIVLRGWEGPDGTLPEDIFERWARAAYATADALLAERGKEDEA